jgi:hypothetical protein
MKREGRFGPLFLIVILFSHTHLVNANNDSNLHNPLVKISGDYVKLQKGEPIENNRKKAKLFISHYSA